MKLFLLLSFFAICTYAVDLKWGIKTEFDVAFGYTFFTLNVPEIHNPSFTIKLSKKTSFSIYYKFGDANVTEFIYDGEKYMTNSNSVTLDLKQSGNMTFFLYSLAPARASIRYTSSSLNRGARVGVAFSASFLLLLLPCFIGALIRKCTPNIDTPSRYRITKFNETFSFSFIFWALGSMWLMMGTAWMLNNPPLVWMTVVGCLLILISIPLLVFELIDIGSNKGALSFKIVAKMVDGSIIDVDTFGSASRQSIIDKMNKFIPEENRPTANISIQNTPTEILPSYSVAINQPLPAYDNPPPTPIVNTSTSMLTVTSQYLQELLAPIPKEEQASVMALFYSNPQVIQGCVNDIKDRDLLRLTLVKLANK